MIEGRKGARDFTRGNGDLPPRRQPEAQTYNTARTSDFRAALAIFAASRLIVILAILYAIKFLPPGNFYAKWDDNSAVRRYLLRWDSVWYLSIMREGYHYLPNPSVQQSANFFPLYPALSWCLARILRLSFSTAALLFSNTASILALFTPVSIRQ